MLTGPIRGCNKPLGQQLYIKAVLGSPVIHTFFIESQKINQQSRQSCLIQDLCNIFIPGTMTATATAMRKDDNAFRIGRDRKIALDDVFSSVNRNSRFIETVHSYLPLSN